MSLFSVHLRDAHVFRGDVTLLGPVTWDLAPGANWAITGDNGSGKSTLLRLLAGELFPSIGRRIYRIGQTEQLTPLGINDRLALLSPEKQDLYLRQNWDFPCLQIVQAGKNTPFSYCPPTVEKQKQAQELFVCFGMEYLARRSFLGLSTGEGRKVLLLQALLSDPDIFFLDEFTTGLDRVFLNEIVEMLKNFILRGKQVVFASHRRNDCSDFIEQEMALDQGQIVRKGKKNVAASDQTLRFCPPPEPGTGLLFTITKSSVSRDGRMILKDISFCQKKGENWAVVGKNGAGKSTFLHLVFGCVHPMPGGEIVRHGILQGPAVNFRPLLGYVAPGLQARWPRDCTVRDMLLSGFYASEGMFQRPTQEQMEQVKKTARLFELETLLTRPSGTLSYGQKRCTLIARALVHSPVLLLLDEPFSGLSAEWREKIRLILQNRCKLGLSLLMVTHRPEDMKELVSHILLLEQGRIKACGLAQEMVSCL